MTEWIPVTEKLPKENQMIKAKCHKLWHGEGIFQDGKFVYSWVKGACLGQITHWMPLPEVHNEWISVKDALPKDDTYIIAYDKKEKVVPVYFDNGIWTYFFYGNECNAIVKNVTHWMPFPEPPKD